MHAAQIALIQDNWQRVVRRQDAFGRRFYERLFALAPEVRPMFSRDMATQANMLAQALDLILMSLGNLDTLLPIARNFAQRHVNYGVKPLHYALVGQALILTLQDQLGEHFTPEAKRAWSDAYDALSQAMIASAYPKAA